ncbi:MAG TPA: adenylate/guanylate cyclase domain-containing protein, partial [Trueperaceae bacterium]|nr:adenylate/guanylate cyclase domain-containing protein [Trueperaceae bacterium]
MEANQQAESPVDAVHAPECVICGTSLAGPLGFLFRLVGIRRSTRNPNLCSRCNAHVEEGRVVELTVLFADLSSFTELTQQLGPQQTHAVVDAFLKTATYVLVRHGAFIDKYVGDAVMAFFNAPIRYPDHAARATAAALEIQAELPALGERFGLDLRASIGVASGFAHVGRLGSGDGKDYTAIGDVVNLAARLQSAAGAGEVVVDAPVFAQVADQFPAVVAERIPLKGFAAPVDAHRLGNAEVVAQPNAGRRYDIGTERPNRA